MQCASTVSGIGECKHVLMRPRWLFLRIAVFVERMVFLLIVLITGVIVVFFKKRPDASFDSVYCTIFIGIFWR